MAGAVLRANDGARGQSYWKAAKSLGIRARWHWLEASISPGTPITPCQPARWRTSFAVSSNLAWLRIELINDRDNNGRSSSKPATPMVKKIRSTPCSSLDATMRLLLRLLVLAPLVLVLSLPSQRSGLSSYLSSQKPSFSSPPSASAAAAASRHHHAEVGANLRSVPFNIARVALTSAFTAIRRVLLGHDVPNSVQSSSSSSSSPNPRHSSSPSSLDSISALDNSMALDEILNRTIHSLEKAGESTIDLVEASLSHIDPNGTLAAAFTSALISDDSALALSSVIGVIKRLPSKGVVNVFGKYPMQDVVRSAMSMSKLQNITSSTPSSFLSGLDLKRENPALFEAVCHYSTFANAAYGWKGDLAFRFRFHSSDLNALVSKTGISKSDIVHADFASRVHRPAFFIARDRKHRAVVLCVRGTLSGEDVLTDLCCESSTYSPGGGASRRRLSRDVIWAHQGMLNGALQVGEEARDMVAAQLAANPGYKLVLVGHSLGAGTAAILGTIWLNNGTFPELAVYAYGPPCLAPAVSSPTGCKHIVSVVADGDPFATLSLGHLKDATVAVDFLAGRAEIRAAIDRCWEKRRCEKGGGGGDGDGGRERQARQQDKRDLDICLKAMIDIRALQAKNKTHRCFPPGVIYELVTSPLKGDRTTPAVQLRRVTAPLRRYEEIVFKKEMLSIMNHIPILYENALNECCSHK